MKNITWGNSTKPPPEKITHTQRYSLHDTAEHALPKDSIRQYRVRNCISLLECFCAKSWKAMTRITDSKDRAVVYICGPMPAYFSSPIATVSLIRRSHWSLRVSWLLFLFYFSKGANLIFGGGVCSHTWTFALVPSCRRSLNFLQHRWCKNNSVCLD